MGGGDFPVGLVGAAYGEFHVGLAGTQPDFTDDDIAHRQRRLPGKGKFGAGGGCREGIEQHTPATVHAGDRFLFLSGKRHDDFLAGVSLPPDWHRFVALQHGAVGEQRRRGRIGPCQVANE